jgi:NCAIR mutase (PurE)-related protein
MNHNSKIDELARQLLDGNLDEQQFLCEVAKQTIASTDDANIDLDRVRRAGFPEVVYAEGKSVETLVDIVIQLQQAEQSVLVTRASDVQANAVLAKCPNLIHSAIARTLRSKVIDEPTTGQVAVVTAGTSDLPVAEEAIETLRWMNVDVTSVRDVGVAGPHRLPAHLDRLQNANSIVVVAGMEGALPSVVAGYLAVPIIAVPTSVGYGANFGGVAALLSMLNSCAANVAVVNIDAGFKGGYLAGMIARSTRRG